MPLSQALGAAEFAALMDALGPFGPAPAIAVGVSGGADSTALALLADGWAKARGGAVLALVVDHRLRAESALESRQTVARLSSRGIAARRLVLDPPPVGPDLSQAARLARHEALEAACAAEGILFLLLAHTRADQAETLLWRGLRGSGAAGLAGMAARRERHFGAVLRPLLGVAPARLRATCRAAGMAWVEDPTNRDQSFARPRLRAWLADPDGTGPGIAALAGAARRHGEARDAAEAALAEELAAHVTIRPEGFALVADPAALSAEAARRLLRTVGGLAHPPPAAPCVALLRAGRGTFAGVQASPAGRLGEGLVLAREPAAVAPPVTLGADAVTWDRRWRVRGPAGARVGALGAARVPGRSRLPARLTAVLPAIRDRDGALLAVPALGLAPSGPGLIHVNDAGAAAMLCRFAPPEALAPPPFRPDGLQTPA